MLATFLPSRLLRSNKGITLSVPRVVTNAGARVFPSCVPSLWYNLPLSVCSITSIATFKKSLKIHLFDFGLFPMDTSIPNGLLMLWNCFIGFAVEHRFGCLATESGFARNIGAIKVWLIYYKASGCQLISSILNLYFGYFFKYKLTGFLTAPPLASRCCACCHSFWHGYHNHCLGLCHRHHQRHHRTGVMLWPGLPLIFSPTSEWRVGTEWSLPDLVSQHSESVYCMQLLGQEMVSHVLGRWMICCIHLIFIWLPHYSEAINSSCFLFCQVQTDCRHISPHQNDIYSQ